MVSRNEPKYILYPLYFDSALSRLKGRKIGRKYAAEKPTVEMIAKAAGSLGLRPILEKDHAHPSTPWRKEGRVVIDKKGPKTKLLLQIANRL
jgi:signal recognition particle subunit SRP19